MLEPRRGGRAEALDDTARPTGPYGSYQLSIPGGDGDPIETGYYVRVWSRGDGDWRMVLEVTSPVPAKKVEQAPTMN